MRLSPDLFNSVSPPEVWVHLTVPTPDDPDERTVIVRLKCAGHRSVTVSHRLDRYCPENSILRAVAYFMELISNSQQDLSRPDLLELFDQAVIRWVEPF